MLNLLFFFYLTMIPFLLLWALGIERVPKRRGRARGTLRQSLATTPSSERKAGVLRRGRAVEGVCGILAPVARRTTACPKARLQPEYYVLEQEDARPTAAALETVFLIGEGEKLSPAAIARAA